MTGRTIQDITARLRATGDRAAAVAALHDLADHVGGEAADDLRTATSMVAQGSLPRALKRLARAADRHPVLTAGT